MIIALGRVSMNMNECFWRTYIHKTHSNSLMEWIISSCTHTNRRKNAHTEGKKRQRRITEENRVTRKWKSFIIVFVSLSADLVLWMLSEKFKRMLFVKVECRHSKFSSSAKTIALHSVFSTRKRASILPLVPSTRNKKYMWTCAKTNQHTKAEREKERKKLLRYFASDRKHKSRNEKRNDEREKKRNGN